LRVWGKDRMITHMRVVIGLGGVVLCGILLWGLVWSIFGPAIRHVVGNGVDTYGVVVSSGPVIASGVNGGNRVIVHAKLWDGELVNVSTMNSVPIPVGVRIRLSKYEMSYGPPMYAFVGVVKN
jgi:hypothetical protein